MPHPKVKISDDSGNTVDVTSNRLDVNAYLNATPTIDIGDVSLLLGGTAASTNAGTMDAQTLRVTLATDDTHWGTVGTDADVDGTAHGQLRYIGSQTASMYSLLATIDVDTGSIYSILGYPLKNLGSDTYTEGSTYSYAMAAVRNDALAALADTDNEFAPFQVNDVGALYTTGNSLQNGTLSSYNFTVMGESKSIDGSALPNTVAEGRNARLAVSRSGIAYTCLTDDVGASDLGTTITTHLDAIKTATEKIDNPVKILGTDHYLEGTTNGMVAGAVRNDTLAALAGTDNEIAPLQVNADGALYVAGTVDLGSTDNAVLDAIAASLEILDDWDDSNYANVNINLAGSDAPTGGGAESGALRVTLANDSTGVISIDDGGNTITVDGTVSVNSHAVTNAGTFAVQAGHDITGLESEDNDSISTGGEALMASPVACKRVDMMADPANTGYIWVGDSSVTNDGLGGGIRLAPGDFYSIDIDNTGDIYVAATVNAENIKFIYYT